MNRAHVWEQGIPLGVDGVELYLRNETPGNYFEKGPLRKPIRIYDIHDIQTLIHYGPPEPPDPDFYRFGFHHPSIRITH